jgi:hypothetical protein
MSGNADMGPQPREPRRREKARYRRPWPGDGHPTPDGEGQLAINTRAAAGNATSLTAMQTMSTSRDRADPTSATDGSRPRGQHQGNIRHPTARGGAARGGAGGGRARRRRCLPATTPGRHRPQRRHRYSNYGTLQCGAGSRRGGGWAGRTGRDGQGRGGTPGRGAAGWGAPDGGAAGWGAPDGGAAGRAGVRCGAAGRGAVRRAGKAVGLRLVEAIAQVGRDRQGVHLGALQAARVIPVHRLPARELVEDPHAGLAAAVARTAVAAER